MHFFYQKYKDNKDYGFKDQLLRATVSIMNNIAEGFDRKSGNQFKHFLSIAKGSCAEVRSMNYLAQKLNYINDLDSKYINSQSVEISKMISGLISSIDKT